MKPLQSAPAPLLSLTKASPISPLTAHTKAQKLRTHAQGKRAEGSRDDFQDRLQRHAAERGEKSERAERAEGKAKPRDAQSVTDQEMDAKVLPGKAGEQVLKAEAERGEAPATAAEIAERPEIEQVVAQVLEGVDPALRYKPAAAAKAAGTVAGHTDQVKRQVAVEQPEEMAGAQELKVGHTNERHPSFDARAQPQTAEHRDGEPVETSASQKANRRAEGQQRVSEPPAVGKPRPDAAAERVANIVVPQALTQVRESMVTEAPPASDVVVVGGVKGGAANKAQSAEPAATRSTLAEQVEHGMEVAMRDLPAPAGDRIVTMRLHPSSLGSLRIAMHVSGDAVSVRFQVGSARAKAAIGKAVEDLKGSIARQGLRVESLEIEEDSALAAPATAETPPQAQDAAGKGFAIRPAAPPGPEGAGDDDGTGRMPGTPAVDNEGGVLQVLTFRLDAVG